MFQSASSGDSAGGIIRSAAVLLNSNKRDRSSVKLKRSLVMDLQRILENLGWLYCARLRPPCLPLLAIGGSRTACRLQERVTIMSYPLNGACGL